MLLCLPELINHTLNVLLLFLFYFYLKALLVINSQ